MASEFVNPDNNLLDYMDAYRLSQAELSRISGVSSSTIYRLRTQPNSTNTTSPATLMKIFRGINRYLRDIGTSEEIEDVHDLFPGAPEQLGRAWRSSS